MLVADALAYYYLRNPLPYESPLPKPLIPAPWRVEILASDINYSVLRAAQDGSYSDHQMSMVDYSYRLRYFDRVGDRYAVKKAVKELVHFDFHNLKTEYLPQRNDVIFCRNVMMYFDEAEQKRLVEKFYRCLNRQRIPVRGPRRKPAGPDRQFSDGAPQQWHGVSARRGESVTGPPEDRNAELRELFFESAQELLQSLNEQALRLEKSPGEADAVRTLRRVVHTLKRRRGRLWLSRAQRTRP